MGAFKLGKMTFGSLFKKPETLLYPFETKPHPKGLKGHIAIDVENCIVCGMCDRSCSTGCISVDRKARTWQIDPFACVQCGYCVVVCPKNCLEMDPSYHPASVEKAEVKFDIPEQTKKPEAKSAAKEGSVEQSEELVKSAQEQPLPASEQRENDAELQTLLDLMEAERAEKVRAALRAR